MRNSFSSSILFSLCLPLSPSVSAQTDNSIQLKEFCNHHDGKLLAISREFRSSFHALCKGYAKYGVEQDDMRYVTGVPHKLADCDKCPKGFIGRPFSIHLLRSIPFLNSRRTTQNHHLCPCQNPCPIKHPPLYPPIKVNSQIYPSASTLLASS
jgi:hypothetical protein